jgi:hypothetical protein
LPDNIRRRPYQLAVYQARERGVRLFDFCWHRRSSKDLNAIAFTQIEAVQDVGLYWYMLPFYKQARNADGLFTRRSERPEVNSTVRTFGKMVDGWPTKEQLVDTSAFRFRHDL